MYKGKDPARALDSFVTGPSVIDCGIFSQLAMWFGIRHMLGNEKFNQLFSNAPFYITQLNFDEVLDPYEPYKGNPFFQFLSPSKDDPKEVSICYIKNNPTYLVKHPGGYSQGDYCIKFNGKYIIFAPSSQETHKLSKNDIKSYLAAQYNKPVDEDDLNVLADYKANPDETHPTLQLRHKVLIDLAEKLKSFQIEPTACGQEEIQFGFDLAKFQKWVEEMSSDLSQPVPYEFVKKPSPPEQLLKRIPPENKDIDFSVFNTESSDQEKLFNLANKFCSDVMNGQPSQVVITGNAGVGKSASAVACAKELASKGIKVIWITAAMITRLSNQTTSMQEYNQYLAQLENLLKSADADVVVLDDINHTGIVLEKCYDWFAKQEEGKGKGLYITSNNPNLSLFGSSGRRLDGSYACVPFCGYTSRQYLNTYTLYLDGGSLRQLTSKVNLLSGTEEEKIQRLVDSKNPMSIGTIVDSKYFEKEHKTLKEKVCLVPGFKDLDSIRSSLMQSGVLGNSYSSLSDEQKNWLVQINEGKDIKVKPFSETPKPIIAVELLESIHFDGTIIIEYNCFSQLLNVIEFAHNNRERRVIIINNTSLSNEGLLGQIIKQMPKGEEKRSIERLRLLLGIQVEEVD